MHMACFHAGVSSQDEIEWSLVWPEMDGANAGAAGFGIDPENELPPMIAHLVESYSGFLDIDLYATVNGQQYGQRCFRAQSDPALRSSIRQAFKRTAQTLRQVPTNPRQSRSNRRSHPSRNQG